MKLPVITFQKSSFLTKKPMIDLDYLSHEELESLAEDAEDYLIDRNINLVSHSYVNIVSQAVYYGFKK